MSMIQMLAQSNIVGEEKGGRNIERLPHFLRNESRCIVEIKYKTS